MSAGRPSAEEVQAAEAKAKADMERDQLIAFDREMVKVRLPRSMRTPPSPPSPRTKPVERIS